MPKRPKRLCQKSVFSYLFVYQDFIITIQLERYPEFRQNVLWIQAGMRQNGLKAS